MTCSPSIAPKTKTQFFLQKLHWTNCTWKAYNGQPKWPNTVCPSSAGSNIYFYAVDLCPVLKICAFPSASSSPYVSKCCHHFLASACPWFLVGTISLSRFGVPSPKILAWPSVLLSYCTPGRLGWTGTIEETICWQPVDTSVGINSIWGTLQERVGFDLGLMPSKSSGELPSLCFSPSYSAFPSSMFCIQHGWPW